MDEMPQTRKGWQKIKALPVPVTIFFDYKEDKTYKNKDNPDEKKFIPDVKGEKLEGAFLHPLTRDEWFDKEAVGIESFRHFLQLGGNKDDSLWRSQRAESCQLISFALRISDEENAARLMDEKEISEMGWMEIDRLVGIYFDKFVPTKEERKNCLRARLGKVSGRPSSSPNNSTQVG